MRSWRLPDGRCRRRSPDPPAWRSLPRRHPVVDRRGGVERDLKHGPRIRDVTPPPPAADGSGIGPNKRSEAVEFRVVVEALAEEERVAGAVRDVVQANVAAEVEGAVPADAGKGRRAARMDRALAGVA